MSNSPTTDAPPPRPDPIKHPSTIGGLGKENNMSPIYDSQSSDTPEPKHTESTHGNRPFATQALIVGAIIACLVLLGLGLLWAYVTGGQPVPL